MDSERRRQTTERLGSQVLDPIYTRQIEPLRAEADKLKENKKYEDASVKYKQAAQMLVGDDLRIPLEYSTGGGAYISEKYQDFTFGKILAMMECCNNIAECLEKCSRDEEALDWLEEGYIVQKNAVIGGKFGPPLFAWANWGMIYEPFFIQRIRGLDLASDLFMKIGNTASALHRLETADINIHFMTKNNIPIERCRRIVNKDKLDTLMALRHPDPALSRKLVVQSPSLQVLGSWEKLTILGPRIQPRMGFTGFVWRRRLYIAGGQKQATGPWFRDIHWIDMDKLDGWHHLPRSEFPLARPATGTFTGWEMVVHKDRAYLFNGAQRLYYFDLILEEWKTVDTKWTGPSRWPYPKVGLVYPGLAVCRDKLYVFGGMHDRVTVGCNLWIVLDLITFEWRKLGGHAGPTLVPEHSMPGPRKHPMIWVEGDQGQERIWLQYGMADRAGAQLLNTDYAADISYAYDDMWSWDVYHAKWRRERMRGNTPCPRSEVAWTYNPVLKKTIIFGGYNPMLPTRYTELNAVFEFSYYADTFIFDSTSNENIQPKWKHVLTRGFPIYRAQAKLFSDPETGKIFLFGGYTNSQFVPDRKYAIQRSFGDLWQLKLDMPRGHFEGVDLEEEALTAKAGPWQRCFTCGSAGPWRKCGGTCCGKAFFCNAECLKEGWKEHRERHGCSKR